MKFQMNTMPSDKESFDDNSIDPVPNNNINSTRTTEPDPGSGIYPNPCPSPRYLATSEATSAKTSHNNKNLDPVVKYGTNLTKSPFPSSSHYQSPCRSPKLATISESNSTSPCTSSSTGVTTTTVGTKTSDATLSDSCTNPCQTRSNSIRSNSIDSSTSASVKRHTGGDCRWEAIQLANARETPIGLGHFRLLKRLGFGDIGSVYLVELRGTGAYFAMKVMDRASLISRNKVLRAQTEREILSLLDHPFLPTLYSHFETEKFYCLVMEYCSGGNLHSLRQKQPNKYFSEQAAR